MNKTEQPKRIFVGETEPIGSDGYDGDCAFFQIEFTKELAQTVLRRRAAYLKLKETEGRAWAACFWDGSADFYAVFSEDGASRMEDEHMESFVAVKESPFNGIESENVQASQMVITDDGVLWRAFPKHCDFCVETTEIPFSAIEALL